METKAQQQIIKHFSTEAQAAIIEIGKTIRPAIDEIHANAPTTQNYYGDYLRLLSYKPERAKLLAIAMLYEGCNPDGIQAAIKLI